ncbi:cytochrome, partial [Bacillus thuringiensis]
EIEIVVNVVLDNMKNIKLEEDFQYVEKGLYTRGPISMPILFDKLV